MFWQIVRTAPEARDAEAFEAAVGRLNVEWSKIDSLLASSGHKYLAGNSLTMGDIPLGCWANRYLRLSETDEYFERPPLPHVELWYRRLQQHPAYVQHVSSLELS